MELLLNLLSALLTLMYGFATVNYLVYFVRQDPFSVRTVTPLLVATVVLHSVYILLRVFHFGRHPIGNLGELLTLVSLAIAVVYLYVERIQRNKATGAFLVGTALVTKLGASTLLPQSEAPASYLASNTLFGVHTVFAVLGHTAFAVGAIYGLMFLLLYRALKRKRFGLIFERLPALDELSKMGFGASLFGWIFLTLTIVLGVTMSLQLFPDFYRDPKFFSSLLVWGVYGTYVATYYLWGWRGARSVYVGLTGFTIAVVAMIGSNFIWSSFHSFRAWE